MKLRLKEIRKHLGMTQREVADKAGISGLYYSQIENGVRQFNANNMEAIARAFGVSPVDLFPKSDDPIEPQMTIAQSRYLKKFQLLSTSQKLLINDLINELLRDR